MRARFTTCALASVALASCVPRIDAPPAVAAPLSHTQVPAPPPASRPAPSAAPAPVASLAAWADAPLSPGGWAYRGGQGGAPRALFGPASAPTFQLACEAGRQISLLRVGAAQGAITVRTSSTARTLTGTLRDGQGLSVLLPAGDPLLDAIAFSRGRFAVEAPGVPPLVVPAWPELARVIEDCRR